jgi:arylsulfatase A-like enzyme
VWLRTTILLPVLEGVCPLIGCSSGRYVPESATAMDWKFRRIAELAESRDPVFVFAHLTVPHEPYIYDARCGHRDPYIPERDDGPEAGQVRAAYVAQVRCTNEKVERLVTDILSHARRQTIIVLQADHGHGRLGHDQPALKEALPWQVAERTDIFAAYFLPDHPAGLLSDSIGPVNAIRAIMRHYYWLPLPPLPEHTFWSSSAHPYAFTRIR